MSLRSCDALSGDTAGRGWRGASGRGAAVMTRAGRVPGNGMTGDPLGSVMTCWSFARRGTHLKRAIEPSRDDGYADLALHRGLVHRAEDDLRVVTDRVVNDFVDLMNFAQRKVGAASDVDEHARRAGDTDVVEQAAN